MWFTKLCIEKPVLTIMLYAAILVLGLRSVKEMPVELFPNVEFPIISIRTIFLGADPETIEEEVSKKIEDAVSTVSGIQHLRSVSQENVSTVIVEFEVGEDLDIKAQDIREKVELIKNDLPTEAKSPAVFKLSFASDPILFFGVTGNLPLEDLREVAEDEIADPLRQINGVGDVVITGGRKKEVRVEFDPQSLSAYHLTAFQIEQAIREENIDVPSGKLEGMAQEQKVRILGKLKSIRHLAFLPIPLASENTFLPLHTFAQVSLAYERQNEITRIDGKEGVGLLIVKASRANTVRVVDQIRKKMAKLSQQLPPGVHIDEVADNSKRIKDALFDVQQAITLGVGLAVLVVFLFLYSLRGTFIVALAIPLSIFFAFIPMHFFGIGINQMSMLGLSLSVGSLVDDSIVVIENIFRHLQQGELPRVAALQGRAEIGAAAVGITFTNVAVFLPVAFMGGIVGLFFRDFGLTVTFAILASLLVSFSLTPALAALLFRKGENLVPEKGFFARFDRGFHRTSSLYSRILSLFLRHRFAVIVSAIGLLIAILRVLGPQLKGQFIPAIDQGSIGITAKLPEGTALLSTKKTLLKIEKAVQVVPGVNHIFATVGSTRGGFQGVGEQGSRFGQIVVNLNDRFTLLDTLTFKKKGKRKKSDEEIAQVIRHRIAKIPAGDVRVAPIRGAGGGFGAPIDIVLLGKDLDQLLYFAEKIRQLILSIHGTVGPQISFQKGEPEWIFKADRQRLKDLHLSLAFIGDTLRTTIEGKIISTFEKNGKEYDIRLIGKEMDKAPLFALSGLPILPSQNGIITLSQVGSFERSTTSARIEREAKQRAVTVTSYLTPSAHEQQVQEELARKIAAMPMQGIRILWSGETEKRTESMGFLGSALSLSIILIYILLASLYNHILYPFIIMLSLPMALIGVIVALVSTHTPMSIVTMIGIILLVGIVVNNAILLVDYANTLRARQVEKFDALVESGRTRLRPILMTALTLIFSLIPTALNIGPGAGFRSPMAITVIGGMLVSTFLTLFLIPSMYLSIDNSWSWLWDTLTRKRKK